MAGGIPVSEKQDDLDVQPDPLDYEPREVRADVEAAKDLILWARRYGVSMDVITIGQVQITGITDLYSRPKVQGALAGSAGRRSVRSPDRVYGDFASEEELEVVTGEGAEG